MTKKNELYAVEVILTNCKPQDIAPEYSTDRFGAVADRKVLKCFEGMEAIPAISVRENVGQVLIIPSPYSNLITVLLDSRHFKKVPLKIERFYNIIVIDTYDWWALRQAIYPTGDVKVGLLEGGQP